MIRDDRNHGALPLMANEEIEMSFGERHGLEAEVMTDHNAMVLTDRRLIRLSRAGSRWDTAFMSLADIQVAEVRRTSRGKKPLLRVALLMAGVGAALVTISFLPLAIPLATVLGVAGSYHLLRYLSVSQEGAILFRANQEEMEIFFEGDMANQAYTFVNRFFRLKELLSSFNEVSEGEGVRPDVPQEEAWPETDETETGTMIDQSDENPVESHKEAIPQEESSESQDEEDEAGQHA